MNQSDVFVILDNVQYSSDKITSRNKIKTSQGVQLLSVPINSRRFHIKDILIDNSRNWSYIHWSTIENNYSKARHWRYMKDELYEIYHQDWEKLIGLNMALIYLLKRKLKIQSKIVFASELRDNLGEKNERIINICDCLHADVFLSGQGAKDYIIEEEFNKKDICVKYQQLVHPIYPQRGEDFISNLSILDLLLNCGEESIDIMNR